MLRILGVIFLLGVAFVSVGVSAERPNVIIVMVDDQGYGDVKAHGHPFIRTPNMDALHAESVRFTDFHVAPMCTPTRAQLLTGVDAMKTGSTAVCQGRSMIRRDVPTIANYFGSAGYKTILSGKWHLGDSYPHRPQDRGFQEVLAFRAWGLPSLASHWGNSWLNPENISGSYDDPILEHNGEDKPYEGYVTDILFDHAMEQMRSCKKEGAPFLLYLATPTPHVPNIAPKGKAAHYLKIKNHNGVEINKDAAHYFGMVENIDDNLGRLDAFLVKEDLRDNTILIYLSDNGTQSGAAQKIFNAGMRDRKTSVHEGGHRVPMFLRWTAGKLKHGTDVGELAHVQDLCTTLLSLCGVKPEKLYPQDGHDLSPLLRGEAWEHGDRTLFVQYQVGGKPWNPAVAMQGPWRLVRGSRLFNIADDPGQKTVLQGDPEHAERFKKMNEAYLAWHKDARVEFDKIRYFDLGHEKAPSTILYASDWQGSYCDNPQGLLMSKGKGFWHVDVVRAGTYRIELSRWPFEAEKPLVDGLRGPKSKGARPIASGSLEVGDVKLDRVADAGATLLAFEGDLPKGKTKLRTEFKQQDGKVLCSANYVRVTLVD